MMGIQEIAQQALMTGCLTTEAENQLRQLLSMKYDWEDFQAFIKLQKEVMEGRVRQESRELFGSGFSSNPFTQNVVIAS
ncbi:MULTISPECIES: hypothetical protein [unclassified Coleofasciculus]|uniref:hypothetical protein n=1 Tax=unclassified Coleofasciculus TaxID=2692782 RepID=UPI001882559F|nr:MULTISPECIES: hypothetical protein [unclassified Coleofasciculus]MBE9125918.1 hypothetical protein [Coleofasciculus sp. LEGE 07081]MBE9149289.1 hypothetical protein [Coleofasciculus sp. LEGE 07092]